MVDWNDWLKRYDRPNSPHSERLRVVHRLIRRHIADTAPEPVVALSICAGDGRDLLEVLGRRADAERVQATLVELDPRLCERARQRADEFGVGKIDVRQADAGTTETYVGLPPADLVLLVGVFGNIVDSDLRATIEVLPALCSPGALIVWSLRQRPPRNADERRWRNNARRVEIVRRRFEAERFSEVFVCDPDAVFYVGGHQWDAATPPLPPGRRFFTFAN